MNRGARVLFTVLMVPVAGVFLLGCPKKLTTTDATPQPKVNELVATTRPVPAGDSTASQRTPASTAPESKLEEQRTAQLLASRGEDIPIREAPSVEFVDPAAVDKDILKPVYFDYDKASIRPEYQPVLEKISKWLIKNSQRQLLIEGHCDERGTDEYNLALGERRALAVRRYLIALGISSDRLHTISYGEEKPAVAGSTEAAWAKNRRCEFKVSAE